MKNKDIEKKLRASLSEEKQAVWNRVSGELFENAPIQTELVTNTGEVVGESKWKKVGFIGAIAGVFAVICMIFVFCFVPFGAKNMSGYFYIDINPSVQVVVGKDGRVTNVLALNDDAFVMLADFTSDEYVGKSPEEVTEEVWECAYEAGYISPNRTSNAILISGSFVDEKFNEEMNDKLKQRVDGKIREKGVYCVILTEVQDSALQLIADGFGITVSKYQLILDALAMGAQIEIDEYAEISIAEIHERIKEVAEDMREAMTDDDWNGFIGRKEEMVSNNNDVILNHVKPDDFDDMYEDWRDMHEDDFMHGWGSKKDEWWQEFNGPPKPMFM